MTQHSKSPWKFSGSGTDRVIADATGEEIMGSEPYYPWCPDKDEDWQLIAAAPMLLEALRGVIRVADRATDEFDAARAAIAAATGEQA